VTIVERSAYRLTLRRSRRANTEVCALNRADDTTTVTRFAFFFPYRQARIPLSQVRTVFVERRRGHADYYPVLETVRGSKFPLWACSKEDALKAAEAIRDFLKLPEAVVLA
jgi:hypothetical protein